MGHVAEVSTKSMRLGHALVSIVTNEIQLVIDRVHLLHGRQLPLGRGDARNGFNAEELLHAHYVWGNTWPDFLPQLLQDVRPLDVLKLNGSSAQ